MPYYSVLFQEQAADDAISASPPVQPDFFVDLNLDQLVAHVIAGREEYDLKPYFHAPLRSLDDIAYRHETFRDLESVSLSQALETFTGSMRRMRAYAKQMAKLYYPLQKRRWFAETADLYCGAVLEFLAALKSADLRSRALIGFRSYLDGYIGSSDFMRLHAATQEVLRSLDAIAYTVHIEGPTFTVRNFQDELDYGEVIASVFEKFRQGEVKNYRTEFPNHADMNHIEAKVLEFVAELNPVAFERLAQFESNFKDFEDRTVARFDREIQFYLAYRALMVRFEAIERRFCYPDMSVDKTMHCTDGFDLALGLVLLNMGRRVVCNDARLDPGERMIVVTGPNQGGKTTFARMFGQLHYLAALGCPVPAASARLYLFDKIFTHFERQENIDNLSGKLQDDLLRIKRILDEATPSSIVIMNEIFTSTTLADALFLSRRIMKMAMELDLIGVWVTFIDEVASEDSRVASMVSTVDPDRLDLRTFRVVRGPAQGTAYAQSLAAKYGLTFEKIRERIAS